MSLHVRAHAHQGAAAYECMEMAPATNAIDVGFTPGLPLPVALGAGPINFIHAHIIMALLAPGHIWGQRVKGTVGISSRIDLARIT